MKKLFSYIFLLSFAATAIAQGASFSISPLGSVLTVPPGAKAPQEVYTLVNPGSQPVSVETVVMTWGQGPKGEALYEESKDFVVYPRIIELKPGATRTVRALPRGISADNLAGRQAYYRVQFTELTKKQDLAADAGFTTPANSETPAFTGTGTGVEISHPLYARINLNQPALAGSYSNTHLVTVTY